MHLNFAQEEVVVPKRDSLWHKTQYNYNWGWIYNNLVYALNNMRFTDNALLVCKEHIFGKFSESLACQVSSNFFILWRCSFSLWPKLWAWKKIMWQKNIFFFLQRPKKLIINFVYKQDLFFPRSLLIQLKNKKDY